MFGSIDYLIWTDGGCLKNPNGKGGYGVVIQNNHTGLVETFSQGFVSSTNNRMEVRAIMRALEEIPDGSSAVIYSDSKYAVSTLNGEWKKKSNIDLWIELDILLSRKGYIIFEWVKGHADNVNNNKCDELATEAMHRENLIDDIGFTPLLVKNQSTNNFANVQVDLNITPLVENVFVNKNCLKSIYEINTKDNPSFSDFLKLKVYGIDTWSSATLSDLQYYCGKCIFDYVSSYLNEDKYIISALRWFCRGLTIENSVKKVLVDKAIESNL